MKIVLILISVIFLFGFLEALTPEEPIDPNIVLEDEGLRAQVVNYIESFQVPDELKVLLIAMLPIFELRGSIPMGIHYFDLPWIPVVIISIIGNMIPIFFILLFFDIVTRLFFKIPILKRLLLWLFARTRKKGNLIRKYEEMGLIFFVAIPLPITGAWTGSLAAYLFGLRFWKSVFFIFVGVLCAAVVVSTLTYLGWLGAILALTALLAILSFDIIKRRKKVLENRRMK